MDQRAVRLEGDGARRQPGRLQGRVPLRGDRRALRPPVGGSARGSAGGALSQHHRQRRPRLRPDRRFAEQQAPDRLRVVPDHARVGHSPRALAAQELRCSHDASRGRDQRGRCGGRRRLRRAPRHHRDQRPGHGFEGREHGARGQPRAAAHRRRRATGWPVDGAADEDRAVRPAARHVRPPRRGADAGCGAAVAEPLLRGRVRGDTYRARSTGRRSSC